MANHLRDRLAFALNGLDAGLTSEHIFTGIPLSVIEAIGDDLAGRDAVFAYANQFMSFDGPVAEGSGGNWTLSGATGAATVAGSTIAGGAIVLTADATAGATPQLQFGPSASHAPFRYTQGKRMWAAIKFKLQTVASMEVFFGFATPDTSPTTTGTFPANGIFFEKAAAATDLDFHARASGTSTERTSALGLTLADDTFVTVGFYVDAKGNIMPFSGATAKPSKVIASTDANVPAASSSLGFQFGFLANALTMTVDWVAFGAEL